MATSRRPRHSTRRPGPTWTATCRPTRSRKPWLNARLLDFIANDGCTLELSVVNPGGVFGPVLGPGYSPSIQLAQRLMVGAIPGCPKLSFAFVDVRDAADLHLRAMTNRAANGERFTASAADAPVNHGATCAPREKKRCLSHERSTAEVVSATATTSAGRVRGTTLAGRAIVFPLVDRIAAGGRRRYARRRPSGHFVKCD